MSSIFTNIINSKIPSYKIYEDEICFAFLDIKPHNLGHTLLVPKQEIADFSDLPDNIRDRIFQKAKVLSKAIRQATKCKRVGLLVHGMGVPEHFHLHLIPIFNSNDMDQDKAHTESADKMQEICDKIVAELG
jgi:histidine triad (HIT) family protein